MSAPSGHKFASVFLLVPLFFPPPLRGSLQWKYIPVMPHCCSLFRFLITNSIIRTDRSCPEHKACALGPPEPPIGG